ncbi:hypothetical protein K523DRAFT_420963 [Schizophyllum commune Tattone D]|nr:hypothetical protein K523DRAFT_420963 [Schizophyllum commune Tattone D]
MRRRLVRLCHKVLPNPKSNATQVPSDATATTSGVRNEDAEASFDIAPLGSEVQHEDLEERSDSAFRHTESAILSTTTSIDSLPVELLSKIFRIHLLDDLRRRRFRNHMVAFERVIPLVCKFWRAVAYAEPWLWTIYDAPKPEYLPALMDRYIPRTGDCPLHLRCWSNERLPNFLQAMSPYASRWATLGIRATYRTLEELMPLATPLLDQMQIEVEWLHEDDQHLSLHFLRGAPRLRNLTLVDYGEALFSFSLPPLPNLTHLVLQLEDYDVSNLSGALGGCRATLTVLDILIYDAQVASIPLDTPSTFPALQKLTLRKDSGRLLDIVSAPVIEYLAVDVIPRESIEALFHFLRRSPTTAKYLQRLRVGNNPQPNTESKPVNAQPRKRQKTKPRDLKEDGDSGPQLQENSSPLSELPLDVLFEIIGYLDPMSLLHLSRTSRALYSTLMNRSSSWLWKNSYATTDHELPPAPDDLTIPKFLGFIVDDICDCCHKLVPKDTYDGRSLIKRIWTARLRCCRECLSKYEHVVHEREMRSIKIVRDVHRYFGRDYPLAALFPGFYADWDFPRVHSYPHAAINELVAQFEHDNRRKLMEDKKKWLSNRANEHLKVREHAWSCEIWEDAALRKRLGEIAKIKKERLKAIIARLNQDGWQEEVNRVSPSLEFCEHALVDKAQPLTCEEWAQIRTPLRRFVKRLNNRFYEEDCLRVFAERYDLLRYVYHQFLKGKPQRILLPGVGDLVTFNEVTDLIEGTPIERKILSTEIDARIEEIAPTRFSTWRKECEDALVSLLNKKNKKRAHKATTADLELFVSVFTKKDTREPVWYPKVLKYRPPVDNSDDVIHDPKDMVGKNAWSAKEFCVEVPRLRLGERLVLLAGLDPAKATLEDMERRDPWYAYARDMPNRQDGLFAMTWREVMRGRMPASSLVVLSTDDTELARTIRPNMCQFSGSIIATLAKRPRANTKDQTPDKTLQPTPAVDPPPRKRAKKETNQIEERKPHAAAVQDGIVSTSFFTDLPLELVLEILSYLDTTSLLRLSRTTKTLRKFLLNRSSFKIWKKSWANMDPALPPPPRGVSVPSFVALATDEFCQFCGQLPEKSALIVWGSRERYCEQCGNDRCCLVSEKDIRDFHAIKQIFRLCGHSYQPVDLLPSVVRLALVSSYHNQTVRLYSRASYDNLANRFENETAQKSKDFKKQWVSKWEERYKKTQRHIAFCERWEQEHQKRREEEKRRIRRERIDEILRRLCDLGWADEVQKTATRQHLDGHELVAKTQPLTDEEWESICGPLLKLLPELRDKRLAQERHIALRERYGTLRQVYEDRIRGKSQIERCFMPGAGDLADLKEVTDMIEGTPVDQKLTKADLNSVIDAIPQAHWDAWNAAREASLIDLLNHAEAPPLHKRPATAADFQLATTVFTYESYSRHLPYPEVLGYHPDGGGMSYTPKGPLHQREWSTKGYSVRLDRQRVAVRVVRLAGLDPKTATAAEMDARDVWFASNKNVRSTNRDLHAMTWRYAIMYHNSYEKDDIVRLPPKRIAQARELYAKKEQSDSYATYVTIPRGKKKEQRGRYY